MRCFLLMIAVVALVGCGPTISDPIVEKAIRVELKIPTGKLTRADLAKVTELDLTATLITDAGLKEVAKMQQLKGLTLVGTKITDAGLKELAKLQKLEYLYMDGTKVTNEGKLELQKALPKCIIPAQSP